MGVQCTWNHPTVEAETTCARMQGRYLYTMALGAAPADLKIAPTSAQGRGVLGQHGAVRHPSIVYRYIAVSRACCRAQCASDSSATRWSAAAARRTGHIDMYRCSGTATILDERTDQMLQPSQERPREAQGTRVGTYKLRNTA